MRLNFEEKIILLSHFDFILIILFKLRKVKIKILKDLYPGRENERDIYREKIDQ